MILDRYLAGVDVGVATFAICDLRLGFRLVFQNDKETRPNYFLSEEGAVRATVVRELP